MKQILGFLISALNWLARPISMIKNADEGSKYIPLDDVIKAVELAYHQWLILSRQYSVITKTKRSSGLYNLHIRVRSLMSEYPELKEFDLRSGSPLLHLIETRAMTKHQIVAKHGEMIACLDIRIIPRMMSVIITYNFFKRYKERAGDLFTNAEENMKQLVTEHRLPGRFSWNKSVPKLEKEKMEQDQAFLDQYDVPMKPSANVDNAQKTVETNSEPELEENTITELN